jgi:hypothetical protein
MRRIEIGDLVKTSYGTGPFRIVKIVRGCHCPRNYDESPLPSYGHIHLMVQYETHDHNHGKMGYLNGYREDDLCSIWNSDYLILLPNNKPVQATIL